MVGLVAKICPDQWLDTPWSKGLNHPLRHLEPRYVWLHWSCTMLPFKMHNYMSWVMRNMKHLTKKKSFHPIGPFRFYVTCSVLRGLFLLSFGLLFKLLCSLLFLYPMKRTARRTSIRRSPGYLATHKLHVRFFSQKWFHKQMQEASTQAPSTFTLMYFSKPDEASNHIK